MSPEMPAQEDGDDTPDAKTDKERDAKKGSGKRSRKKRDAKQEAEDEALSMRLLRLQADFDNFRKRTLREKSSIRAPTRTFWRSCCRCSIIWKSP